MKSFENVVIAGSGYLGRKIIDVLLKRQIMAARNIITLVKTEQSQALCRQKGCQSYAIDLDNTDSDIPDFFSRGKTLLYYFMPPPRQGKTDSRVQCFISHLKKSLSNLPEKIVLISTTGVYGNCYGQWVDETAVVNPKVDRAFRRVDAERQFQSFCQAVNIPLVILRVSGIYGPGKLPMKRIRSKTAIVRQQDSPYSNRIHSDDLIEICFEAGFSEKIDGIFNCADGHPTTMYDYFMKVAQANHLPPPPVISLVQARKELSPGMMSYMDESRRININKLISHFKMQLKYPNLKLENLIDN